MDSPEGGAGRCERSPDQSEVYSGDLDTYFLSFFVLIAVTAQKREFYS